MIHIIFKDALSGGANTEWHNGLCITTYLNQIILQIAFSTS